MYLRTLYELLEEGIDLKRARIVERLHQSGPTVSQTVSRMERDGLLVVRPDRSIELTQEGHDVAQGVMRRHRLAECLLTQVIGLARPLVHDEACRWEHVISPEVEQRIARILGDPRVSPYGTAIPRCDHGCPPDAADFFRADSRPLDEMLDAEPTGGSFVLVRMSEYFQATEPNLETAERVGMLPGSRIEAHLEDDLVVVTTDTGEAEFPMDAASGLFVAAVGETS
ncbi:metal-dependent transcriptional regulator [Acidipropionibacterium timonense]|uniref:metal-dependent transcriptional regulator n=1 Tax=Acidipropionibacterium timonense TaxID=2161818 RepID=UPI0010321466